MRVVGIDPGLKGAVALFNPDDYRVEDMPVSPQGVDPIALSELLGSWHPSYVFVEDNRAQGGNGSLANFSMGHSMGSIIAVVLMMGIPLHRVRPQAWQQGVGLGNVKAADRKEASRQRARELFPSVAPLLARKADHNRAEALLIAAFGFKGLNRDVLG